MNDDFVEEHGIPALLPPNNRINLNVKPELEPEDQILALTHNVRLQILDKMTAKGLPEDPADRKVIVSVLKDMDAAAMGRKRIKVEEKQNNDQSAAAALIAMMMNGSAGRNPFKLDQPMANREAPLLPDTIPEPETVEGEMATTATNTNYDDFMASMGNGAEQ